jgi:hypothetical protein
MHAVVVTTAVDDSAIDPEFGTLQQQVIPAVRQLPGFVGGYWLRPTGGTSQAIVVFETEENGRKAAESMNVKPGTSLAPGTEITGVEFIEVIGHA